MELCNLRLDRLMSYLLEAGGEQTGSRSVAGQGWSARLIELEPGRVGVISVPRDLLVIEGDAAAVEPVHGLMRRRTMRGGG